jgi:type I restriction enzyme S subunit
VVAAPLLSWGSNPTIRQPVPQRVRQLVCLRRHSRWNQVPLQSLLVLLLRLLKLVPPLPSLYEQHEMVRRVDQLFALTDQIEARYTKAKQYIDGLKQSFLPKAFRDELVPQDPNEEPASILLERIRQARAGRQPRPSVSRTKKSPSPKAKEEWEQLNRSFIQVGSTGEANSNGAATEI